MATIRDSVLHPIQVFEPNPRERALDALRTKLGREPTPEDIAVASAAEMEANPLRVVSISAEPDLKAAVLSAPGNVVPPAKWKVGTTEKTTAPEGAKKEDSQ